MERLTQELIDGASEIIAEVALAHEDRPI